MRNVSSQKFSPRPDRIRQHPTAAPRSVMPWAIMLVRLKISRPALKMEWTITASDCCADWHFIEVDVSWKHSRTCRGRLRFAQVTGPPTFEDGRFTKNLGTRLAQQRIW